MTEDEIRERIVELTKLRESRLADANAIGGALQDCEFWLQRLEAQKSAPPSPPKLVE